MLPSSPRLPCNFGAGGDDRRRNTVIVLTCVGTTQTQARSREGSTEMVASIGHGEKINNEGRCFLDPLYLRDMKPQATYNQTRRTCFAASNDVLYTGGAGLRDKL